jgi:hypothetical protein
MFLNDSWKLNTHELHAAQKSLGKIRLGELEAKKAVDEDKIEALFFALDEARREDAAFKGRVFTRDGLHRALESRRGLPTCDSLEWAITAAFASRAETKNEMQALNA